MPFFALSILVQIFLIVHVIRTGRATFWVWIILFAPLIGSLVYLIVEVLPTLLGSRSARKVGRKVKATIDPNRDVRATANALQIADTIENRIKFANALKDKGMLDEALDAFNQVLTGLYKYDPNLLLRKAEILFAKNDFQQTREVLDTLIRENPDFKSPDGHLLYAKATEGSGDLDGAEKEYRVLSEYYAGPEPKCRLAILLKRKGQATEASKLFNEIMLAAKQHGAHYRNLHAEWLSLAKKELAG